MNDRMKRVALSKVIYVGEKIFHVKCTPVDFLTLLQLGAVASVGVDVPGARRDKAMGEMRTCHYWFLATGRFKKVWKDYNESRSIRS